MPLTEKHAQLVEDLSVFPDSYERFTYVVDRGGQRPRLPDELKLDEFLVPRCTATLWLVPEFRDGLCYFRCESDSPMVQGLAGLYCDAYSGATPREIIAHPPTFLHDLGLDQHLSPNRRRGMEIVWNAIRSFAESRAADRSNEGSSGPPP